MCRHPHPQPVIHHSSWAPSSKGGALKANGGVWAQKPQDVRSNPSSASPWPRDLRKWLHKSEPFPQVPDESHFSSALQACKKG